ncbi:MAG TPA: methyl-accepting chemotaxis protein [Bryobacteraceae bacterium]|nr:methyl-accepting chemotaxis protein [Bryobacteraceae bacterium]
MNLFGLIRTVIRRIRWRLADVAGTAAVLPVLRAQLREVAQNVEESVVQVCGNFTGMADRARKTVEKAREMLGGGMQDGDASVERSIEASRATIGALLDRLEHSGRVSSLVVARMEEVEQAVAGVESLLAELQKIAFSNKLVALNAKIESVHVGRLGAGFEVVADEISRQGDRSNGLAETIGERVREMRSRVKAAALDLRTLATGNQEKLIASRVDAEGALNVLQSVHLRARDSLEMMSRENSRLAEEISGAVMGLQFQDRTSQRIAHVVDALEKVEQCLGGSSETIPGSLDAPTSAQTMLEHVRGGYTMESEREVLKRMASGPQQTDESGDIELF